MNHTTEYLRWGVLALLCGSVVALAEPPAPAAMDADLRVYLPRTRTVEGDLVVLDDVAMLLGEKPLLAKAGKVKLGRTPQPGEAITLDRRTVLARLAAEGIDTRRVEITGSQAVTLRRDSKVLDGKDIVFRAESYLKQNTPPDVERWEVIRHPRQVELPDGATPCVACRPDPKSPNGHLAVFVDVTDGNGFGETRRVVFKLFYRWPKVTATRRIAPGEKITPDNAEIQHVLIQRKPDEPWTSPFGSKARVALQPGAEIRPALLEQPKPPLLIKRNKLVRIKVQGPGWLITALGKALDDGRLGEVIRVRNVDSNKIIAGRVDELGDVVPLTRK